MADSDALRPYKRTSPPSIEGGEKRWMDEEFARIEQAIGLLVSVVKKLEVRIEALEP